MNSTDKLTAVLIVCIAITVITLASLIYSYCVKELDHRPVKIEATK